MIQFANRGDESRIAFDRFAAFGDQFPHAFLGGGESVFGGSRGCVGVQRLGFERPQGGGGSGELLGQFGPFLATRAGDSRFRRFHAALGGRVVGLRGQLFEDGTASVVPVRLCDFALAAGVGEWRGVIEFLFHLFPHIARLVDLSFERGGRFAVLVPRLLSLLAFRLGFVPRGIGLAIRPFDVVRVLAFVFVVVSDGVRGRSDGQGETENGKQGVAQGAEP